MGSLVLGAIVALIGCVALFGAAHAHTMNFAIAMSIMALWSLAFVFWLVKRHYDEAATHRSDAH